MKSSTREIFVHILIRDVWILEKRSGEPLWSLWIA